MYGAEIPDPSEFEDRENEPKKKTRLKDEHPEAPAAT
jgi:hypothetical protein